MANQNIVLKKWSEPYVLLETLKKSYDMKDLTFDGFSKNNAKSEMFKFLSDNPGKAFGLYMKNVNKFYLFSSAEDISSKKLLTDILGFSPDDYELSDSAEGSIGLVDMAKAEAAFLF